MFSSNELVQLVFANEDDVFCCEDLTKPYLRQYLWRQLHAQGHCGAVYLLCADEKGKRFTVRSFGDRRGQNYVPKKSLFGKGNEQAVWIRTQLQRSAAFVCPLEDFCRVAESGDWEKGLRDIAESRDRRGFFVLTAPPEAERSAKLLLDSPVFDWIHDNAVLDARSLEPRELFRAVEQLKGAESCVFLNEFNERSLRELLRHAMLAKKDCFLSEAELDAAASYLDVYLRSVRLQCSEPLFELTMPAAYLRFRDLIDRLADDAVWERLMTRAQNGTSDAVEEKSRFPLYCGRESVSGQCIRRLYALCRVLGPDTETARLLESTLHKLMAPDNRPENPTVAESMQTLSKLASAQRGRENVCTDRLLTAIGWCSRQLGAPSGSEAEKRAADLRDCLTQYVTVDVRRQSLEQALKRGSALPPVERELLEGRLQMAGEMAGQFAAIADQLCSPAHELALGDTLEEQLVSLQEKADRLRSAAGAPPAPELSAEQEPPIPKTEEALDFSKDDDWLYGFSARMPDQES